MFSTEEKPHTWMNPAFWRPRKQLAMKDRNLKLRNVTWVFEPDPWLSNDDQNVLFGTVSWSGVSGMFKQIWIVCRTLLVDAQDTVYGRRDGVISGIAITHKNEGNRMRQTHGWKTGVVMGIRMCPRNEMYKPEVDLWFL